MHPPRILLGVNIDHIATLRQARGTRYPDPIQAALLAEEDTELEAPAACATARIWAKRFSMLERLEIDIFACQKVRMGHAHRCGQLAVLNVTFRTRG